MMKNKRPFKNKFTDEELYLGTFDIEEIMNDPKITALYEKHYKGDLLYQDTTSDMEETFPSFSTKKLKLALKVIRGQNEEGETQRVGDRIEKELKRREKMYKHITVYSDEFKIRDEDYNFNYQDELTPSLDSFSGDFDQNKINEIVLWKVNRYAKLDEHALSLINTIQETDREIDENLTKKILRILLDKKSKGIQLPMASTILRFKNKYIYQIIDQRVYRSIYSGRILELKSHPSKKNIEQNINAYLDYLTDLREVCDKRSISFEQSDRVLYNADKHNNKNHKLRNY
jgi:hypothetical protein